MLAHGGVVPFQLAHEPDAISVVRPAVFLTVSIFFNAIVYTTW